MIEKLPVAGVVAAAPARHTRSGSTARVVLRCIATAAVLDGFAQAMFAGKFLAGNYDALGWHDSNSWVLTSLIVALAVIVVVEYRLSAGPRWPMVVAGVMILAEGAEVALGKNNLLELHVPLGVALICALMALAVRAWQPPTLCATAGVVR